MTVAVTVSCNLTNKKETNKQRNRRPTTVPDRSNRR